MACKSETKSLESLPVEMIEAVLDELPPEDLRNMRLLCKDIEEKMIQYYTKFFFTDRKFVLSSQYSVEDLYNISRHPRLGKSLRRVTLVLRSLHYMPLTEKWSAYAKALKAGNAALTEEQRNQYIGLRRAYASMADGVESYLHKSKWNETLHDGLNNLVAQSKEIVSLRVTAYPPADKMRLRQLRTLEEALGPLEMIQCHIFAEHIEAILGHGFKFGCSLTDLTVPEQIDLSALRLLESCDADQKAASLSALQKLDISFIITNMAPSPGFDGLDALLASSPQLTSLKLRASKACGVDENETRRFSDILSKAVLPKLRSADLSIKSMSRGHILSFVKTHISTLREFRLNRRHLYQDTIVILEVDLASVAADADVELEFEHYLF